MKINFSSNFYFLLNEILEYIATDKPFASRKFKSDLLLNLRKDLKFPYNYKKSIYFNNDSFRDYVFKGYVISCQVFDDEGVVNVIGIIKNRISY